MTSEVDTLRIHHLLCIPLFVGEGYSDAFSENMTRIIQKLKEREQSSLRAICAPDMICAGCPNLQKDGSCGNSKNNQVVQKDVRLAEAIEIKIEEQYMFQALLHKAREKLTKEIFDESCAKCEWYIKGLCSYEKWINSVKK